MRCWFFLVFLIVALWNHYGNASVKTCLVKGNGTCSSPKKSLEKNANQLIKWAHIVWTVALEALLMIFLLVNITPFQTSSYFVFFGIEGHHFPLKGLKYFNCLSAKSSKCLESGNGAFQQMNSQGSMNHSINSKVSGSYRHFPFADITWGELSPTSRNPPQATSMVDIFRRESKKKTKGQGVGVHVMEDFGMIHPPENSRSFGNTLTCAKIIRKWPSQCVDSILLSNEKNLSWLGYIGDYTTQLYRAL